ncbi:MAG: HAD family hydrolase [Ignavibacteriaceae bacterium]|nr:HAD family hydrolase [Ignavibacteriaceae bacterium]NUM70563.1 HAD family hydrolase [Ignavibacteriaceae bacterium]
MTDIAVFIDRDGTINHDPGYLGDPDHAFLIENAGKGLAILKNELGYKIFVVSNQSGISRGLISRENVDAVNERINELLLKDGAGIDKFYYCPHHPDFSPDAECSCRKPLTGMIERAAKEFDIDLSRSFMIGDSKSDIECGKNAGLRTILVKTGNGIEHFDILRLQNNLPDYISENLYEACIKIKELTQLEN